MANLDTWTGIVAVFASGILHAATPEHDHPFRLMALRRRQGRDWAVSWVLAAGAIHIVTCLVLGWLAYHTGIGLLGALGTRGLFSLAAAWCVLYAILTRWGGFTGHLQSPRTSLLRLEERRMKLLTPQSLAGIEGLNPCLLPWGLWASLAPWGLGYCLAAAAGWSVAVSLTAVVKLRRHFPRHPHPWLGPWERSGDLLAALPALGWLVVQLWASSSS